MGAEAVTVGRSVAGDIQVNGANCGAANVTNTDTIKLLGTPATSQQVTISLANGPLGPGQTAESTGTSEIEVQAVLLDGYDKLTLSGGTGADNFRLGTGGANLDADNDGDDVVWSGLDDSVDVLGRAGNDSLSAEGGLGTGSPLTRSVNLAGGLGGDRL